MNSGPNGNDRYAIIAGNGRFPFLVLEAAREQAIEPEVFAIEEEASPKLGGVARSITWLSLGEIAKLLEMLSSKGVNKVLLAGQVKHAQLFSSIQPDSALRRALTDLERKNTDALLGAFVRMLEQRGIEVMDSTLFLKPLLAEAGALTRRSPDAGEQDDIAYGREIAKQVARLDIGQTIVVSDRACLAVEAMEGTDAAIARAAKLSNGRRLVVVKVSKPNQDMRFDVPVIGAKTIEVMKRTNARALAVDAGKTLFFERARALEEADRAAIAIVGIADAVAPSG
jgi:UDP-2,3-diacylglucosamine hydrolase